MDKFLLVQPLKKFYQQCLTQYRLGDKAIYNEQLAASPVKYCFNPYLSTECDVQIKLAGVIEQYFLKNNISYSVNSEMKVYGDNVKNQRCDLTIHEIPDNFLYLNDDSHKQSLRALIEIKYANAVHPNYEFKRGLINSDLKKLSSIPEVLRYFVLLDENDSISLGNCGWLINECNLRDIILFTNNSHINFETNYPFGYDLQFALTKQEMVSNTDYSFAKKEVFLSKAKEFFQVTKATPTYLEIKIDNITKADLYYKGDFDTDPDVISGNCIVDVHSASEISPVRIGEVFRDFASGFGARLLKIGENEDAIF